LRREYRVDWGEEDDRREYGYGDFPDDRPRRRARRRWRGYERPHRGGTILTLGILSLVFLCIPLASIVLGIIALTLGGGDIQTMDRGGMDPEGRGQTNAGRICGLIALILSPVVIVLAIMFRLASRSSGGFR
jgi:hypothetical protein